MLLVVTSVAPPFVSVSSSPNNAIAATTRTQTAATAPIVASKNTRALGPSAVGGIGGGSDVARAEGRVVDGVAAAAAAGFVAS